MYYRRQFNSLAAMLTTLNSLSPVMTYTFGPLTPTIVREDFDTDEEYEQAYEDDFYGRLTKFVTNNDHTPHSYEVHITHSGVEIERNAVRMASLIESQNTTEWYAEIEVTYLVGEWELIA